VLASARAAWDNRQTVQNLPLFAAFWDRAAELPTEDTKGAEFVDGAVNSSAIPERDLSVQLAGWMLMEAAHTITSDESGAADDQ
jgi:predicted alpha-1,6-mannanase (GH76 family)